MTTLQAILLAIIEGLTEFLPVSSTGHILIGGAIMKMDNDPFFKLYTVAIQFGAILSVVVLYFKNFFRSFDFYWKLLVAFIPAAILGFLFAEKIDEFMENITGVCIALLLGGICFLFIDKFIKTPSKKDTNNMSYLSAFQTGCFQCLALFPGVSRSGATIIGGLAQGFTPKAAAEFSFFLAVPTMFAATAKKCLDYYQQYGPIPEDKISLLLVGNAVAFFVAIIAIKGFISLVSNRGFSIFGWYRIILAACLLYINSYVAEIRFNDSPKKDKSVLNPLRKSAIPSTLLLMPEKNLEHGKAF